MRRYTVLLFLFFAYQSTSFSQLIIDEISIYEDTFSNKTIDIVKQKQFIKADIHKILQPNITYWLRFKAPSYSTYYLLISHIIDSCRLFTPSVSGYHISESLSYSSTDKDSNHVYRFKFFKLSENDTSAYYFLKFKPGAPYSTRSLGLVNLWSDVNMFKLIRNEYFWFGSCVAILGIIFILSFSLYLRTRERLYLYYLLYVLSAGIFAEESWGFAIKLSTYIPFSNLRIYDAYALPFSAMTIFLLLYAQEFLNTKRNFPFIHKSIYCAIGFKILLFIIAFFSGHVNGKMFWHHPNFDTGFLFLPLIAGCIGIYKKIPFSWNFVVAVSLVIAGMFFHSNPGVIFPILIDPLYYFIIGELILFSITLVARFRYLQVENRKVLEEKIIQMKENDRIKEDANMKLEEKVDERTRQLYLQAIEIEQMNNLLKKNNISLERDVKELSKARVTHLPVSFEEFTMTYPNEEACIKYLFELKWGKGFICKKCSNATFIAGKTDYTRRCNKCWAEETVTAHTIFHKLKFPLEKAFYLLFLVTNNRKISLEKLSTTLGLSERTCWSYKNKIIEAIEAKRKHRNQELSWDEIILL